MAVSIHPAVDRGVKKGAATFEGGTLTCKCSSAPVTVKVSSQSAYNHICGCTKCWKPTGALMAMVAVAPRDRVEVVANGNKLKVVDASAAIQRHACSQCDIDG